MISESILITDTQKMGTPGYAGNFSAGSGWESCRERFQESITDQVPGFYYALGTHSEDVPIGMLEALDKFIEKIEDIMSLYIDMTQRTVFSRTQRPAVCHVVPAKFWKTGWYQKSLFTLFLRSGLKYSINDDSIEKALREYSLSNDTFNQIMRFLSGHILITKDRNGNGIQHGWVELFRGQNIVETRQTLKRPINLDEEEIFVGYGTLYN